MLCPGWEVGGRCGGCVEVLGVLVRLVEQELVWLYEWLVGFGVQLCVWVFGC